VVKIGVPVDFFGRFVQRRRAQIFQAILQTMRPGARDACLEVGGPIESKASITEYFSRYLVLNIEWRSLLRARELPQYRTSTLILGDGTRMPLNDRSVDYVVSNAVLEHIPRQRRSAFALEIMRVARKGYFVSTPNFWFPMESHYSMPFFQFLPEAFKRWVTRRVQIGWINRDSYEPIAMVTRRELRRLFPNAHIMGLSFFGLLDETLIAWQRADSS